MSSHVDETQQLVNASERGYGAQKAALQAKGVQFPQHNVSVKKTAAKKTAKKAAAKEPAKKTAKKTTAKKSSSKKS